MRQVSAHLCYLARYGPWVWLVVRGRGDYVVCSQAGSVGRKLGHASDIRRYTKKVRVASILRESVLGRRGSKYKVALQQEVSKLYGLQQSRLPAMLPIQKIDQRQDTFLEGFGPSLHARGVLYLSISWVLAIAG